MLHFIYKLVVGLLTRSEAADDPGIWNREYSVIVPLDKHIAQESFECLINDSSRAEHATFIVPQIVSSWLNISFHTVPDAVSSEVRIITLLVSELEMVFTFKEVADIRDVGAPLTHFQLCNILIVILKEVTWLADDISVAVAWGFELSLTNG